MKTLRYFTTGYGGKRIHEFIEALKLIECDVLYDIRSFPQSKNPTFNSDFLKKELTKSGIQYRWVRQLGGKIKFKEADRINFLPKPYEGNVVFMCSEKLPDQCHRKEIAELMKKIYKVNVEELFENPIVPTQLYFW